MGKRFFDLHVHSTVSNGAHTREAMAGHAKKLGTELCFCDGKSPFDGLEISFKSRSDLKVGITRAAYLILRPLSKEAFQLAVRFEKAIVRTALTPTAAKAMQRNKCAVEVPLFQLFNSSGKERIKTIKEIKKNLKYSRKYGVASVVTTGADSIYGLRSPYQVFELLRILGFTDEEADESMEKNPREILKSGTERNK